MRLRENAGVCNTAHDRDQALGRDSLGERLRKNGNAGIAVGAESQANFAKLCHAKATGFNEGTLGTRQRMKPHRATLQIATLEKRADGAA